MTEIELYDNLGDYWGLMFTGAYKRNGSGLWETWVIVQEGPPTLTKWYPRIPIPVFTEWWTI